MWRRDWMYGLLDVAWAAVSFTMSIPVRPKEVPIAMLISPLSAEAAPVKVDRRCREGPVGRKEPSHHYRGLSSFVRKMMYETASPLDPKENTTERADARENTVPIMETDGLVLSPGYCQGSRWKWARRMKDLIHWRLPSAGHAALTGGLPSRATVSDSSEGHRWALDASRATQKHSWHFPLHCFHIPGLEVLRQDV